MAGSPKTNVTHSYQVLLTNFQTAIISSLADRCAILTQLLHDSPVKELQYIFPTLVEHIFGFRNGADWGLLTLEKDIQSRDFEVLKRFLAPDGPVLRLVYRFTEDISPKFEYPISCLPGPSQMMLQEGKVPPLYANKLQILNPGLFPSIVQFNAFEFYFFHFAYFIVNPTLKNTLSIVNQQDTLYAYILEDYLFSFLPTDGRAVPLYQAPSNVQQSPLFTSSLSPSYGNFSTLSDHSNRNHSRPDFLSPVRQKPSLLKKGTVMMVASSNSSASPHGLSSSPTESWRSETFLLILKEMYLNQNSLDQHQNMLDLMTKNFVPSHYHVWMVRILVKHLHFFFNSSYQSSGHGQIMIDSLGRLKSLGMSQLIQKEMYCFLKCTFDHWPLDASFRVPLETWLSYIQPWRYTQYDLELVVWQKFMTENVLFYTSMFQQVLKRFLRMDLSCPKNAYMLYRLTKVFSMGDMRKMIMQAERGCLSKPSSIGMTSSYIQRSPEKSLSFRKFPHLETPVTSLFSEPVFTMVAQLLSSITSALEKKGNLDANSDLTNRSLFSMMTSFMNTSNGGLNSDDNSPSDARKVSSYLEASAKQLCLFFQEVSLPTLCRSPQLNAEFTPGTSSNQSICTKHDSKIHDLTVMDRVQLLNNKRKPSIQYHGNPDLQPVRTYELAFLVKLFNEISQFLNEKYATKIQQLYNNPRICGKISRRILAKPTVYYNVIKSKDMQSVVWNPVSLPPRICLRFLANKMLIGYFVLFILISAYFDYNPVLSVILLFAVIILCIVLSAFLYPVPLEIKQE